MGYARYNGFTALSLPFIGGDLQFLILLPDEPDGIKALSRKLTPKLLAESTRLPARKIVLFLPKFTLDGAPLALASALQSLGMTSAFDQPARSANFNRIAPSRPNDYLALNDVFHQVNITLNEHGTEASAATVVTMVSFGARVERPPEVHVDRPFIFAIQHRTSSACLFLGQVMDPR
jgi:serpin B